MSSRAFVTILTSDSYLPGALVTARSIKDVEKTTTAKFDLVCLVTLDSVSVQSIKALSQIYDMVISVEEISSRDSEHELNLLGRQDLSSTITKLHIWRLVQYEKVIYLDSDTLLLRPISHLFELAAPFSACPDIGWPDCFNSGLMVLTPCTETFDGIFKYFLSQGSWDGGDQGLLNDFFSKSSSTDSSPPDQQSDQPAGWNRLSFIYNVTPSAYYTYAPAYKRYSDKISMIHFIGSEKPWHLINRRRYRNALFPGHRSQTLNPVDYDSLVDSWLDVYERVVGPVEPLEWAPTQTPFTVPKYTSEWDSSQPSVYKPPTFEELKEKFDRKKSPSGLEAWTVKASIDRGGYMSLPFLDLSRIVQDSQANKKLQAFEKLDTKDDADQMEQLPPTSHDDQGIQGFGDNDAQANPEYQHIWDPSRSDPPNQGHQMSQPIDWHYEPAWNKPVHEQSRNLFQPPAITYDIPPITHQDYSQFSTAPHPATVKPVFPWEGHSQANIARGFPADSDKTQPTTPPHEEPQRSTPVSIPSAPSSLSQRYRNAWDEDPMIARWAKSRNVPSSPQSGNARWGKEKVAKAALVQTPRLELKSLFGESGRSQDQTSRKENMNETDSVGQPPTFGHHPRPHHLKQSTLLLSSYRSERDCEDSSQDADEEDEGEGEDDDQAGHQAPDSAEEIDRQILAASTEEGYSETLKGLPSSDENPTGERPGLPRGRGSIDTSFFRLPITRSIIVGVPVQRCKSSSSSSSSSGSSTSRRQDSDSKNFFLKRVGGLMG